MVTKSISHPANFANPKTMAFPSTTPAGAHLAPCIMACSRIPVCPMPHSPQDPHTFLQTPANTVWPEDGNRRAPWPIPAFRSDRPPRKCFFSLTRITSPAGLDTTYKERAQRDAPRGRRLISQAQNLSSPRHSNSSACPSDLPTWSLADSMGSKSFGHSMAICGSSQAIQRSLWAE